MFERIKPTTQIRTVALPGDIADTLQSVYLYNKIEKRGIIIKGNHGGLRVVHNARIRDTYVPIEESWLAEFQKRFPDYELPTLDIAPYSQFGAVIYFSCFETNLSDEDIWTIVEMIINDDDSDRELLYTKMRKKQLRKTIVFLYWKTCKRLFVKFSSLESHAHDMVLFADISKNPYNRGVKRCLIFFDILMGILRGELQ